MKKSFWDAGAARDRSASHISLSAHEEHEPHYQACSPKNLRSPQDRTVRE